MTTVIDTTDPKIAALLAGQERSRELVQIAGDDGVHQSINMAKGKHESKVTYKDFVLTVDVYAIPHEPLQVHLICPLCHNQLRVTQDRKQIDWDPATGALSIEPFKCTWEKEASAHRRRAGDGSEAGAVVIGGSSMCTWQVGITKNRALDA